ncbi:MAG: methylisocitrate lyase [Gammaproteobacteria bacterium]|nr:methylisocitrate lyase [Gammaproteobacteria bacterium]
MSQGHLFRLAVQKYRPLPILGVLDAYTAKLAAYAGANAIYLSGAGVANSLYALPDLALTSFAEVKACAERICLASNLPLLVDIDTGFGSILTIARTIVELERIGVAAVQIEDQPFVKRCGHRDGKSLISTAAMVDRIKAAVDARIDPEFVIMARTDALAVEDISTTIVRIANYVEAGADMIFLEAITDFSQLEAIALAIPRPILVNSTEFGKTPIYAQEIWAEHGAAMVLYPLSAFRCMAQAAFETYQTILQSGSQETLLTKMQTRQKLYDILNYEAYESLITKSQGD